MNIFFHRLFGTIYKAKMNSNARMIHKMSVMIHKLFDYYYYKIR